MQVRTSGGPSVGPADVAGPHRWLVVGHDASRSGAPIQLLSFLGCVLGDDGVRARLVLVNGGPLVATYREVLPTTVLDGRVLHAVRRGAEALSARGARLGEPAWHLADAGVRRAVRSDAGTQLVVANSVASLPVAAAVAPPGTRLACWVHELDHVVDRVLGVGPRRRQRLDRVDHFVAAGEPVRRMLIERYGVPVDRVTAVDPFVDVPQPDPTAVTAARRRLTGSAGRPLVLAVGGASHRKGTDRFVDLMGVLDRLGVGASGAWLGADPSSVVAAEMRDDLARAGLADTVRVFPSEVDPAASLAAADVVVSTAREDPFPLGLIEAAALGVPVVATDAGGVGRLLVDAGLGASVIRQGDTLAMAERVAGVLADPAAARREFVALSDHVRSAHSVQRCAPQVLAALTGDRP